MEAYYYSFDSTGCDPIDKILSAVACAGKAYHHTNDWNEHASPRDDHTGGTPIDWIQNAAIEAAAEIQSLRDQIYESIPKWQANELQREIERLRAENATAYQIGGKEALLHALHPEFGSIYDIDGEVTKAVIAAVDEKSKEIERLRAERKELRDLLVGLGAGIPAAAILRAEDRDG